MIINGINYEIVKDYNNAIDQELLSEKITDYFDQYDYIVGDWSYGKLRLKGFTDKNNKINNEINDISTVDDYLNEYCAYGCKYFILKKINVA